jgi:RNA polymerase sigma factor (sigma-70 family)
MLIKDVVCKVLLKYNLDCNPTRITSLYHEVVVEILKNDRKVLRKFDPSRKIKVSTYIYAVTFNKVHNVLTKELKDKENIGESGLEATENDNMKLSDNEIDNLIRYCRKKLSPVESIVFKLYQDNKEPQMIADLLDKKIGNIFTINSRANEKMKECLSQRFNYL